MVNSSDIDRGRHAAKEDRTQQIVRQHEATQQGSFFKNEILPRAGIVGFLAGWSFMAALNSILKNNND